MGVWSSVVCLFSPRNHSLGHVFLIAIPLRLIALCMEPTLSDDIFRYVWEGYWITQGGNPYWVPPQSIEALHWAKNSVNHPHLTSIYPPLTQLVFAGLSWLWDSLYSFKLMSLIADLGILWALMRLKVAQEYLWIYALHPLSILESSASGHMESWGVCAMMMALALPRAASIFLWLGAMLKLLPGAVLIPQIRSMWGAILASLGALGLCAYFSLWEIPMGAAQYAEHWSFHAAFYPIIHAAVPSWSRWICMILGGSVVLYAWLRLRNIEDQLFGVVGAFILLSPTVHPWYLLWIFPLALLRKNRPWILLCAMYPLWYVALTTWDAASQSWEPPLWPQIMSYGIFFAYGIWEKGRVSKDDFLHESEGRL